MGHAYHCFQGVSDAVSLHTSMLIRYPFMVHALQCPLFTALNLSQGQTPALRVHRYPAAWAFQGRRMGSLRRSGWGLVGAGSLPTVAVSQPKNAQTSVLWRMASA